MTADYLDLPGVFAFNIIDEPGWDVLKEWKPIVDNLRAVHPEMDCHIDLINMELAHSAVYPGKYLDYFMNNYFTDHVASDPYPFGDRLTHDSVQDPFFVGLNLVARYARKADRPYWTYVQTAVGLGDTYRDIKFSIHAGLAFGVSRFMVFNYNYPNVPGYPQEGTSPYAMLSMDGTHNEGWYAAQKIIRDIRTFDEVYEQYDWVVAGAYVPDNGKASAALNNLIDYAENLVVDVSADNGLILGEFEEINGSDSAVTLFNASDLPGNTTVEVRFRAPDAVRVTAYLDNVKTVLTPDENGYYTVSVPSATSAFIPIEYYE